MNGESFPRREQVLYRKWRPQTFAEVAGQDSVTRTLRNAIASGRIAHAYLLCGPRGTGKTSLGRLIAKAVNCQSPQDGEPCNRCPSCESYLAGQAPDLLEMDAASNRGIDEIRRLRDRVGLAPMGGRYKVYLVDEVHMLTQEAYNALLKTLEEPPPHVIFVLATTEPQRLPATIVSRCQRFDLRRVPLTAAVARLGHICQAEGFALEERGLEEIARAAGGSLRDAINLLEQVVAYYGPSPTTEQVREALGLRSDGRARELVAAIVRRDLAAALRLVAAAHDDGLEMRQLAREVVAGLRSLLLIKAGAADTLELGQEELSQLTLLAQQTESEAIMRGLRLLARADFRDDPYSPLPLELALVEALGQERPPSPAPSPGPTAQAGPPREAPAAPQDPPASGSLALPPDFLERLRLSCREVDRHLAALLNGSCEVKEVREGTIVLGFYWRFHLDQVGQPTRQRQLEEVASRLLGQPVTVRCEMTQAPSRPRGGGHLLKEALRHGAVPLAQEEGGEEDVPATANEP